jgi:uncharacterized protein (DUF697 family)
MSNNDFEKKLTAFIIHGFAVAHAITAALLAQTVVGDEAALTALTVAMIISIARIHNRKWNVADALSVIGVLAGWYIGTRVGVFLIKWIPGIGNGANALATFATTQLIGWTTYLLVRDNKKPQDLTESEKKNYKTLAEELQKKESKEAEKLYESMTKEDKEEYKEIMKQLRKKDLPEDTIKYLTKRLETIARKYV